MKINIRMKKIILLIIALIITLSVVYSQDKPEIVTDRPDQTEAPNLVPRGGLQIETGFAVENDRENNTSFKNITYNTTLVKYGVNEHFELRLISEFLGERMRTPENLESEIKGLSPLSIGLKINLSEEKEFWPQVALIGHISLKSGSNEFAPDYTYSDFRFTAAHKLSDRIALSYNVGVEWNGETPEAAFLYTLSIGYTFTDRFGAFIETYSFFPEESKADNRADMGFTYKFSPTVQWDISAGCGLSSNAPDSFLSTGISFRLFK